MSWEQEQERKSEASDRYRYNTSKESAPQDHDRGYGHVNDPYNVFDDEMPKKKSRMRSGCALFLAFVLFGFIMLGVLVVFYVDSDGPGYEDYGYEEYAPDLRMDLSRLFSSDEDWNKGYDRLEVMTSDLEKKKDTFNQNKDALKEGLRLKENIDKLIDRLEVYANLKKDTDIEDNGALDMLEMLSSKKVSINERLAFIDVKATEIPLENLKAWSELAEFKPYKEELDYWIEFYDYGFNEEHEALIAGSQRLSEVPEEIFDAFHYQMDIEEKALDYSDFVSDDEDRRAQAYLDYYDKNIIGSELLASALEGEVIANNYITKLYGYEDPFTVYLEQDGIDIEEYETFHDEVKKGLVLLHRWKKIERQLRGIPDGERLHIYDEYLPWINGVFDLDGGIEFDKAQALVKLAVEPLGTEYVDIFEDLMDSGSIDVLPRDSKIDGAYTWGTYETAPYVLINYYGDLEDVLTLGHEMGHAVHQELSRKNQSYGGYNATVLISEMASTTNEALMFEYILSHPDAFEAESREALLVKYAQSIDQTIYWQLMASEFQRKIHADASEGINLDADHLNTLWGDLVQEYYGPDYEVTETDKLGWTNLPHLYWGFYVQNYSIGYTAGISNAVKIVAVPDFKDKYLTVLKEGGTELSSDQLTSLGYGKSGELAVAPMLDRFEMVLDEIEKIMKAYEK